jgi:hypothetical protein
MHQVIPQMHWQLLESSAFTATAYLPAKHILYLRFRSGELYRYLNFPPELFRDLLAADSKAQFFSRNIRDRFACEHLPRSRTASPSSPQPPLRHLLLCPPPTVNTAFLVRLQQSPSRERPTRIFLP